MFRAWPVVDGVAEVLVDELDVVVEVVRCKALNRGQAETTETKTKSKTRIPI